MKVSYYGVKEFETSDEDPISAHAEDIRIKGHTVIKNLLSEDELRDYRNKLDDIYQKQVDEFGGEENLRKINDAFIVRLPLCYDDLFLELATNKAVLSLVEKILGDYFILMLQNGIINLPTSKNFQTFWHRDLNYQHFISSRPLSVSALFCLDPFNVKTGGTHLLPGTHKIEKFPTERYVLENEIPADAPAGSVIIFDSMLYHRAGVNLSKNTRRGVNHMYCLPFIKQQISLPQALGGKFKDNPYLSKFLGYESEPGLNVMDWRNTRLNRIK